MALFLFGAEPPAPLTIANPVGLAARDDTLLICDLALSTLFRWNGTAGQMTEDSFRPSLQQPFAVDLAPGGVRLVCDRAGARRVDESGTSVRTYALPSGELKPGGVLAVGNEVWVTNLAAHCIEVFGASSGEHLRSIGAHGRGPAQFAFPRALARTPEGHVAVVDMLNNRVQVLDSMGHWVRDIGQPGDSVGCFGRPKDVAIGPDGTVFVTDAFSQRVQVFAADARPLLAFGEPGSGIGALTLPAGIAILSCPPPTEDPLPIGLAPLYYVAVAEQLNRPGVRIYAWLGGQEQGQDQPLPAPEAVNWKPSSPEAAAVNPHWDASACKSCHKTADGRLLPVAPDATDALCLSCHDGSKAPADPHPIGRDAQTQLVTTPTDWPTVNGTIGCLTCHDIQRHCRPDAKRPAINTILLRGYDPQRPLAYCGNCHRSDVGGRFSPHRQRDATGRVREDACLFCHTQRPEIPADGRRQFTPHLRTESSAVCLNCHTPHWDLSPLGHVDRPVTPRVRRWMLVREPGRHGAVDPAELARLAAETDRHPARLPLGRDRVTCYTCHNPHYAGLFPPDSELGALASNPEDRASALRTDWIDLCSECHQH